MTPYRKGAVSAMMQYLGRYYVRYFNLTYNGRALYGKIAATPA